MLTATRQDENNLLVSFNGEEMILTQDEWEALRNAAVEPED